MEQQIQDLIASIRKEGIDTAKAESAKIIAEAEDKAASIVKAAEEKAQAIVSKAEKEVELSKASSEAAIKQAARDVSLSLKKSIEDKYTAILRDKSSVVLHGSELLSLIKMVLEGDVSGKRVEIPSADMKELRSSLSAEFAAEIAKGLEVQSSSSISSGFRIVEKDGSGYVDYSVDECVKLLKPYLSDSLKEILG